MTENRFPAGWDEDRVRRIIEHCEGQSDEEAVAEDEAAHEDESQAHMEIPVDLVPDVRDLIARRKQTG